MMKLPDKSGLSDIGETSGALRQLVRFLIGAAVVSVPVSVSAQEVAESGVDEASTEILVTAQKREQRLQDVPITMQAFSGEDLARYGVAKPEDIKFVVPGLDIFNPVENAGLNVSLRGVSINTFTATTDPAVAVYLDEMYLVSLSQLTFESYDMASTEVLKGPQGTLFGRNTPGGLIHFKTKQPTRRPEGYASLEAGSFGRYAFEAAASGPLSETLAGRFSVRAATFDGYFRDGISGKRLGGSDTISARAQLLYEPNADTAFHLTLHYGKLEGTVTPFSSLGLRDPQTGGLCAPVLALANGGGGTGASIERAFNAARLRGCYDIAGYNDPDTNPLTIDYWAFWGSKGKRRDEAFGGRLRADFDLGSTSLTSVTTFEVDDQFWQAQQFGGPLAGVGDLPQASSVESYSQELRLASDGAATNWVLGLFASYDAIGFDIIDSRIFNLDYSLVSMQKTTTFAGFGQADWKLSDTLSLTTGVRATHEHRAFRIDVTGDAALGIVGDPAGGSLLAFGVRNKASAFALSGRLGLNYKPSDDLLVYASLSNGTKSPAYNTGFISFPQAAGPAGLEKIYAAELGIKSTLADGRLRLNGAVFYYRRKDIQGVDFVPNSVPPIQVIRNFGDADTTGFELDANWRPLDGLTLSGGISVLDAKIVNGNFKGNRLPSAPKFSATFMARYEAETASGWTISPQFDGRYVGERNRSVDGKLSVDIDFIGVPALNNLQFGYWQLNSGIEIASPDRKWVVSAGVRNMLNKMESTGFFFADNISLIYNGEPRVYMVKLSHNW